MIMIVRRKNSISKYLHSPRISAPPTQICQLVRANKSDNGRETVFYLCEVAQAPRLWSDVNVKFTSTAVMHSESLDSRYDCRHNVEETCGRDYSRLS